MDKNDLRSLKKSTIGDFVTLLARAQTPQSEIDADLTPLTKCRLNRHFVIKAKRHEGQAARGLPPGSLNRTVVLSVISLIDLTTHTKYQLFLHHYRELFDEHRQPISFLVLLLKIARQNQKRKMHLSYTNSKSDSRSSAS